MMHPQFEAHLAALLPQGVAALRKRYAELFGELTRAGNKVWLVKRIAWRLKALAVGVAYPSVPASGPPRWPTWPPCACPRPGPPRQRLQRPRTAPPRPPSPSLIRASANFVSVGVVAERY
jgi:hypothetical protein